MVPWVVNLKMWVLHKLLVVSLNWGNFFCFNQDNDDFITTLEMLSVAFSRGDDKCNLSATVPNHADSCEHKKTQKDNTQNVSKLD